jgi:anti-sigma regulatory factor (Ser/Thr protein kinase)
VTEHSPAAAQGTPPPSDDVAGHGAATVTLPASREAASLARRRLHEHAATRLTTEALDDALILTSELVTNAVLHGAPEITLSIRFEPAAMTVMVADAGPELPPSTVPTTGPDSVGGRGLMIVDAIATRWGITARTTGRGKIVWFELAPD